MRGARDTEHWATALTEASDGPAREALLLEAALATEGVDGSAFWRELVVAGRPSWTCTRQSGAADRLPGRDWIEAVANGAASPDSHPATQGFFAPGIGAEIGAGRVAWLLQGTDWEESERDALEALFHLADLLERSLEESPNETLRGPRPSADDPPSNAPNRPSRGSNG